MGTRRKSRELCLQMLFQWDMGKQTPDHVRKTFWAERAEVDDATRGFANDIFQVGVERNEEIDEIIKSHAQHWRMDRMATVGRNLLPASAAELIAYPGTPRAVTIHQSPE